MSTAVSSSSHSQFDTRALRRFRIPAALCGTYGLKPTFGLVSHFGVAFGSDQSIDFIGPMARMVENIAAALDAVGGYDRNDSRQDRIVPVRVDSPGALQDGVKGVRLGIREEGFLNAVPDVRDAVMGAVDVLVAAGATATRVSVPEHLTAGGCAGRAGDRRLTGHVRRRILRSIREDVLSRELDSWSVCAISRSHRPDHREAEAEYDRR